MAASQEDFLFAEHVLRRGFATEEQVQECLKILDRIKDEMQLEETLGAILVKRGYIAKAQAHAVESAIHPQKKEAANQIEGYRLLARIGAGAMGSVYKAEHLKLHIPVALKVLRVDLASSPTQVERLKREAQLAAKLDHPNVVRSLDVGESNGFHYFAMEYVEGTTVREAMRRRPLKEKEAIRIVRDVARALEHAHARGIIHRDVKPGNVMITPDGTVKLTDLGLARGQEPSELTLDHAAIGTPHYIAPEQARRGADATSKSDLFSLGASLYHMVTGKPPFFGESLGEIFQRVLSCNFDPPESLQPDLSIDTTYVIHRLMRGNPRERYAGATELIADLDAILDGKRVAPPDFRGDYRRFLERRRRRRIATVSVGGGVLVTVAVVLALWYRGKEEERDRVAACRAANENTFGVANTGNARTMKSKLEEAERTLTAHAGSCSKEELSQLRTRVRAIRHQAVTLEEAEQLERASAKPKAEFRTLATTLDRLSRSPAHYDGVRLALETIGTKIRERSDRAWKRDRSQVYGELAWEVGMGQ
ncbi:MAG: serine/threonine-protein kinase, partial [Planctomycetota bacterium]|nr:serine/threonine-protein kinase [Planctomycetota bacterium]